MAEYSANAVQTVNPGESVVFTASPVPCTKGYVRHRDETGGFLLSGGQFIQNGSCPCARSNNSVNYLVDFGANIAVPTGGTVGEISLAIQVDNATVPTSTMTATPAAVEEFFNVSRAVNVPVWRGCCQTLTVTNVSNQPVLVQNANIIFAK